MGRSHRRHDTAQCSEELQTPRTIPLQTASVDREPGARPADQPGPPGSQQGPCIKCGTETEETTTFGEPTLLCPSCRDEARQRLIDAMLFDE